MKRYALLSLLIVVLIMMLIISGCSKNQPTEPDQNSKKTDLDKPYGGFDTSDERPGFGDPEMSISFTDDDGVTDLISSDPTFTQAMNSDTINVYYVRITWGLLDYDSTATDVITWDGSATINRGKLGIMKTIRFEPSDKIVLPRQDRKTIQWVSNTTQHYDGILLVIVDKDTLNVPGEFSLTTSPYTRTFSFAELDSLALVETVTPQGHQVSIQAYSKQIIPLGGGFLEGKWMKNRRYGGCFKGKWMDSLGTQVGHLKGIWGENRFGEKVFYGKYVMLTGRFGGLLAGEWAANDQDETNGWFKGRWVNRMLTIIGTLEGNWTAKTDSTRYGYFDGKWKSSD